MLLLNGHHLAFNSMGLVLESKFWETEPLLTINRFFVVLTYLQSLLHAIHVLDVRNRPNHKSPQANNESSARALSSQLMAFWSLQKMHTL